MTDIGFSMDSKLQSGKGDTSYIDLTQYYVSLSGVSVFRINSLAVITLKLTNIHYTVPRISSKLMSNHPLPT